MPDSKKYLVIDIGSNSVRYMLEGSGDKRSVTTRLGHGIAVTGRLDEARMADSIQLISRLAEAARQRGFIPVAYATSAVRDAANQSEFLQRIYDASGIRTDVLSGEREAEYAYRAATGGSGGLIDVGGASMQLVASGFGRSFPIGCVRGRDIMLGITGCRNCDDDFPRQRKAMNDYIDSLLPPLPEGSFAPCTGVGGSIRTLVAFSINPMATDKDFTDGRELTRAELETVIEKLVSFGPARQAIPLLSARHDVILYGAAILAHAMDVISVDRIRASTRDGIDGYLAAIHSGEIGV